MVSIQHNWLLLLYLIGISQGLFVLRIKEFTFWTSQWLWTEIKPRFCKTSENYFFGDHLKVQAKLPIKIEKMRVDLHRVTWLWWIQNQKLKISVRRFNDDNLIKIFFAYHQWILHKISQLSMVSEFWNFIRF